MTARNTSVTGSSYEAGIDGLRAVAVTAVLLFHAEIGWAAGGFLGVSLFFTLSGFLITRLLLDEAARSGRIDLRRFWTRRLRRLAPASRVCLLLIAACAGWFAASGRPLQLRGDLLAALGYVANWRFLASHQSYADLFLGGPSPVLHFWSLSIEEQFYLVYPAMMAAAVAIGARVRRAWVPLAVVAVVTAGSVVAAVVNRNHDVGYYATHLRAGELLVGALAAFAVRRVGMDMFARSRQWWTAAGSVGLVAFIWLSATVHQSEQWLTRGGFAALALVWCVLIVGVLVQGPLRAVLSTRPLVALGKLSFSLYLFHWPVFQVLTPQRVHVGRWWLLGLRVVVSLLVATASYFLVEAPVRRGRVRLVRWQGALAFAGIVAIVALVTVVRLQPGQVSAYERLVDAPDGVVTFGSDPVTATTEPPRSTVVVVGDDAAVVAAVTSLASGAPLDVVDLTDPGCSQLDAAHSCVAPAVRYSIWAARNGSADVVVLAMGAADHDATGRRMAAAEAISKDEAHAEFDRLAVEMSFVHGLSSSVGDAVPVLVVDAGRTTTNDVVDQLLERESMRLIGGKLLALGELTVQHLAPTVATSRTRVMVIGDSTSYGDAVMIDRFAADRYDVLWAGRHNCPIAPAVELRWWEGAQWTMGDCLATQAQWPRLIADFKPDALLIALSLPELSDQRYANDQTWYTAVDPRFVAEHDAAIDRLAALVAPYGTRILVADAPHGGPPAERIDAWNLLLGKWATRIAGLRVLPFGAAVEAAEAQAGHQLRPDGIHVDDATLSTIVQQLILPELDAAVAPH